MHPLVIDATDGKRSLWGRLMLSDLSCFNFCIDPGGIIPGVYCSEDSCLSIGNNSIATQIAKSQSFYQVSDRPTVHRSAKCASRQ